MFGNNAAPSLFGQPTNAQPSQNLFANSTQPQANNTQQQPQQQTPSLFNNATPTLFQSNPQQNPQQQPAAVVNPTLNLNPQPNQLQLNQPNQANPNPQQQVQNQVQQPAQSNVPILKSNMWKTSALDSINQLNDSLTNLELLVDLSDNLSISKSLLHQVSLQQNQQFLVGQQQIQKQANTASSILQLHEKMKKELEKVIEGQGQLLNNIAQLKRTLDSKPEINIISHQDLVVQLNQQINQVEKSIDELVANPKRIENEFEELVNAYYYALNELDQRSQETEQNLSALIQKCRY